MAKIWIEFESEGEDSSARWGSVTEEQLDLVLAFAESLIGKPDTIA